MKYAIVKDEVVTNLVVWDGVSPITVDGELILATDDAWIGGSYTDGAFVARVPTAEEIALQEEAEAKAEAMEALKASAISKLEALGLTEAEANLLAEGL